MMQNVSLGVKNNMKSLYKVMCLIVGCCVMSSAFAMEPTNQTLQEQNIQNTSQRAQEIQSLQNEIHLVEEEAKRVNNKLQEESRRYEHKDQALFSKYSLDKVTLQRVLKTQELHVKVCTRNVQVISHLEEKKQEIEQLLAAFGEVVKENELQLQINSLQQEIHMTRQKITQINQNYVTVIEEMQKGRPQIVQLPQPQENQVEKVVPLPQDEIESLKIQLEEAKLKAIQQMESIQSQINRWRHYCNQDEFDTKTCQINIQYIEQSCQKMQEWECQQTQLIPLLKQENQYLQKQLEKEQLKAKELQQAAVNTSPQQKQEEQSQGEVIVLSAQPKKSAKTSQTQKSQNEHVAKTTKKRGRGRLEK